MIIYQGGSLEHKKAIEFSLEVGNYSAIIKRNIAF